MSPSEKIDDYARGWSGLMKLVRNGYSWSGGERNRFFLNGTQGRFHEMSHLAGLDHADDGRAIAITDWDQDGKPDLWFRNRTAPRLRLMLNRRESSPSIQLKLEGTACNRDAIGAIVELLPSTANQKLVRSVRAGDLFLSQSSKWLHFGLGGNQNFTRASVIWPGGQKEVFKGIDGKGGAYLLKQGTGRAKLLKSRKQITLAASPLSQSKATSRARIILPARVPFPNLTFRDAGAKPQKLAPNGKTRLLVLWSGTCKTCKNALAELTANQKEIRAANLALIALSVDAVAGSAADISPAYDLVDQTKLPFSWGLLDGPSAKRIHQFQESLFDRTPPASVPLTILLDANLRAQAIYRGEIPITTILQDVEAVRNANAVQLFHFAPPMAGTWFTNPLPPVQVERLFKAPQ